MPAEASVLGGGLTLTETVKGAASLTARFALYPSILYNLARNRLQDNWHWWDKITEHVILGALPFASMLETFQDKGVRAVVTLNEDFEVFISSEQYKEIGISHLHIPTVDYLYAPPVKDLHRGVQFIAEQAAAGEVTYVHCKAGRGRSTTLVICYLVRELGMSPQEAYAFVRQKRPQVCLADGQWNAVRQFYKSCLDARALNPAAFPPTSDRLAVESDDDAGTPLNDLSLSCAPTPSLLDHSSCQPADDSAQQVTPSAAAAAGTEQPQATVEGGAVSDMAAVHDSAMSSAADAGAPQRTGGEREARSCSEAAVAVAAATETRLRGAVDRCCGQLEPAEAPICTGEAAEASSVVQKSQTLPALQSAQHASAASLAQSEPVLVSASDAESMRSAATTTAAQSCFAGLAKSGHGATSGDAARFGGAEGASSRGDASVRSLSHGSLSMVLCEDFGTALCDADDPDEALPPLEQLEEAAAGLPGSCPEESASKRRRSAEATDPSHGKAAEGELLRADSELQRIHDWASVCRDGTLETVERYS